MPTATPELRDRWHADGGNAAWKQLGENFTVARGVISPVRGYKPTDDDYSAIDYLFQEWDYGYEGHA